jgi:nucleotide-binding universal stress UspA family protein
MSTILIATDGSSAAQAAVDVGVRLASEHGSDVVFVHAYRELAVYAVPFAPIVAVPHEVTEADDDTPLLAAAEIADQAGVTHDVRLVAGDTVTTILRVADEVDAEMIVIGSNRHGAIGTALLGSVSLELLRRVRRPVLIVHPTPVPALAG